MVTTRTAGEVNLSKKAFQPRITVFHCGNAVAGPRGFEDISGELKTVPMPCSSMTREVFLLRAFEAGADAVIVLVCPEGACQHGSGNLRAAKRVARVKKLLDEIGLGGKRLNLFQVPRGDDTAAKRIINETIAGLATLGQNPAV